MSGFFFNEIDNSFNISVSTEILRILFFSVRVPFQSGISLDSDSGDFVSGGITFSDNNVGVNL